MLAATAASALLASPQASLVRRRRLSGAWTLRLRPAASLGVASLR